jgi:hypothetical protein
MKTSNAELDQAVSVSKDHIELRERLLAAMANQGLVSRDRANGVQAIGQPQRDAVAPSSEYKYERVVRWHESLNKRPLVIRANSIEELNELENQLTS